MSQFDLIIKSNKVITPAGVEPAFVLIKDGKIADVVSNLAKDVTTEMVDAGNSVVMAGVIDPHVHINEPGRTDWEGFDTATKAALAGGVTTVVDMPLNSSPVTTTVAAWEEKIAAAKKHLHAHCGFWGGVVPGNEKEIKGLIDKGVLGFKSFLTHSGIDDFPNITENDLRKVMPIIAQHKLPLLVHCELTNNQQQISGDPRSYPSYLASRPKEWEDAAIALIIRLCEEYNCPVHIVHLSSAQSIEPIRKAKEKGLPLTVETAPHYLFFAAENIADGQTPFKCAPPIREKENNDLLWHALQAGIIDFVATDHSPAPPELKQVQSGDFTKAWGGIASLQFLLPVLWTAARQRGASLNDMARWLCHHPAQLAGIQQRKGKLAKGYDADVIVWDSEKRFVVSESLIQHKHKITPYLHLSLYGVVEQTFLNGINVFESGHFTALNKGNLIFHKNEQTTTTS